MEPNSGQDVIRKAVLRDIDRANSFYTSKVEPVIRKRHQIYEADRAYYDKRFWRTKDQSDFVSYDFWSVVQWAIPVIMNSFFGGSDEAVVIVGRNAEDVQRAELLKELIQFQVMTQNKGFLVLWDWFTDAFQYNLGAVKIWWERVEDWDEAKIAAINDSIAKAERRIAMYQDRLKPGNLNYTPNPYDEFSGKVSPVSTIAGQNTYNTAFKLMEADDITTSHNDDFSVNPNFPQERQIRNRSNSVSQQEVERIAATLDPNALGDNYLAQNGAPIIAEDNSDLSGNGRVLAIRRAYSHHPEQANKYRQFIIDNAANFGVDPDLAARMEKPVLVRVLLGDNDLAKFATEANSNTIQQLSAGEQAIKDLDIINKSGIMQKFDPLKPLAQQTEVLKDFAAGLQPNERNNFFTDAGQGGISNAGLQRVQDAISAYAYGNSEIIGKLSEAASDISRNVSNALKSLAGRFAHLKATNRGHLDISNDIAQAIQHLDRFRRNKSKSVSEQAAQQNLSGNGQNIDEQLNLSPEAELLLRFFDQFGNQPNTILQGLANYAQLASSQAEDGQQTIDPDLNRDKLSILREALGDKTATVQQTTPQATQQTTPTTANSLPTATQAQQNTLNVTALNDTQQAQKAPQVTAWGSNEAYYDDDAYNDYGGDNSAQLQDIPEQHTPDNRQIRKAPNVIGALGANEAYYGNDYYSDRGGDNSNPEQDIPEAHLQDAQQVKQNQTGKQNIANKGFHFFAMGKEYYASPSRRPLVDKGKFIGYQRYQILGQGYYFTYDLDTDTFKPYNPDDPLSPEFDPKTRNEKFPTAPADVASAIEKAFRENVSQYIEQYAQQDNSSPQGARLVENSQVNTSDVERKQAKSIPDYSDDTDPTNLRPVPLQQNRQPYNNIDTIGLNNWQYQDNSDFDTPLIADISDLQQVYANEQQTQKTLGNSPNLNDNQGRGNLGSDIGNRSQVTSHRKQADISSEQNNDDNSQFNVR